MTPNLLDELEGVVAKIDAFRNLPFDAERRKLYTDASSAATEFLRTHAPALTDMAKRLESAERDAPALTDAQCDAIYSALDDYGREVDHFEFGLPWHCDGGPEKRREVIRAAIDATQEGAG